MTHFNILPLFLGMLIAMPACGLNDHDDQVTLASQDTEQGGDSKNSGEDGEDIPAELPVILSGSFLVCQPQIPEEKSPKNDASLSCQGRKEPAGDAEGLTPGDQLEFRLSSSLITMQVTDAERSEGNIRLTFSLKRDGLNKMIKAAGSTTGVEIKNLRVIKSENSVIPEKQIPGVSE